MSEKKRTPYRCSRHGCHLGGEFWLLCGSGPSHSELPMTRIPGGPFCKACVTVVVTEYAEKLPDEKWEMEELTDVERGIQS